MAQDATNTTVTFRLPDELHEQLLRRAEASELNKHKMARQLVIDALSESKTEVEPAELDVDGVQDAFESVHDSLADLRTALGRGIGAILQDLSPTRSKEEIRKWVFERIITPSTQKPLETPEGDEPP